MVTMKQHTEKYYNKSYEESKKEKERYQKKKRGKVLLSEEEKEKKRIENNKRQYKRVKVERQAIKEGKPRRRLTEEEKAEKRKNFYKEVEKERKKLAIKTTPAIPLDKVLKMISQIGTEEVSSKTGISEDILKSWVHKVWQPRGKMAVDLQEYLKSVKH